MVQALLFGIAFGSPAATPPAFAPAMPSVYEMLISWDQTAAGKTYSYTHKRSYDVAQQLYRDDQMDGDKIVTSTVYRPSDKLAYQYGQGGCVTWDFESRIDGFPPVDGFPYNLTDKVGDEFSKTFYDPTGKIPLYRLDVWFDGTTPVQYHNTDDEATIVGGLKHITDFKAKIEDKDRFTIPKEWNCKSKAELSLAAASHPASAPAMPSAYEMLISWDQTAAGKTY